MEYAILSLVSFTQVFALGFQSRNVNHGNYALAAATSFFIGLSQVLVWKRLTSMQSTWVEALIYAVSGAIGILCAMKFHSRYVVKGAGS